MDALLRRRMMMLAGGSPGPTPPTPPRLPSGYTEVEYIENTTTARINTGISGICSWTIVAQLVTTQSSTPVLIARGTAGGHFFGAVPSRNNNWGTGAASGQYVSTAATTKSNISLGFTSLKIVSGTVGGENFSRTASSNSSADIFLFNATSSSSYPFKGKVWGDVVCVQNDVVVFRGVPCIDPNNNVGLYDLVGEQFLGSSNSAVFTAGPII